MRALPLLVLSLSLGAIHAQAFTQSATTSTDTAAPKFDVVSIKPTPPGPTFFNALFAYPGGRILAKGATVEFLLMEAFDLQPFQIANLPAWAKETRFDIQAKPSDSIAAHYTTVPSPKEPPSNEQRIMLQNLLIDRFHLKAHTAQTAGPVFLLTRTSHPLRLQPPKDPTAFHWAGGISDGPPDGDGLRGINISMPEFSARLSSWLERPVEDHTGLTGTFDLEAKYGDEDAPSRDDITSSIFTSLKSLGLELNKGTGPVKQIVVDEVSAPSAN